MQIFGLSNCETCRKAIKALRGAGFDADIIDVRTDGVSEADLDAIAREFGDDCVNVRSTTYRNLSELQKLERPRELIEQFPTVMKRPVIKHKDAWFLGWGDEVQTALL